LPETCELHFYAREELPVKRKYAYKSPETKARSLVGSRSDLDLADIALF